MKTFQLIKVLGLSAVCSLVLSTVRAEETQTAGDQSKKTVATDSKLPGGHEGKGGDHKAKFLAKFDKNGDGKLDDTEKAAARQAHEERRKAAQAKFDKNGDGKLDDAEKAAAKQAREEHRKTILAKFDKNGDGKLDDAEKATAKAARHEQHKNHKNPGGGSTGSTS